MYTIYADGVAIDHPNLYDSGYIVLEPVVDTELNTHGSFQFTMPSTHPLYAAVKKLQTTITVYDDTQCIFAGRVLDTTRDFQNNLTVYCEGELAYLCDSTMRPYSFQGTTEAFLQMILSAHNSCVDQQIMPGTVTVTDPDGNGVLVRASAAATNCWDCIKEKLLEPLGGYLRLRTEGGVRYLDYLADLPGTSDQVIKFGENLLDLREYLNAADVVTVLTPYGAQIKENGENENTSDHYVKNPSGSYDGNRVTIRSVNGGQEYIENEDGVALWGRIWGTHTWDDVTVPDNLLKKAQAYLADTIAAASTLTIAAVDLHMVDVDVARIQVGQYVEVYSRPHNLHRYMACTQIKLALKNPKGSTITLGDTMQTLTNAIVGGTAAATRSMEIAEEQRKTLQDVLEEVTGLEIGVQDAQETAEEAACLATSASGGAESARKTAQEAASQAASAASQASSASTAAAQAAALAQQIANGTYAGGTFIDGTKIYAPEIYGNLVKINSEEDDIALQLRYNGDSSGLDFTGYGSSMGGWHMGITAKNNALTITGAEGIALVAGDAHPAGAPIYLEGDTGVGGKLSVSGSTTTSGLSVSGSTNTASLSIGGTAMADFVVETGTQSTWTWRKWNSGIMEMWVRYAFSAPIATQWYGIYTTGELSMTYPVAFVDTPVVTAAMASGSISGIVIKSESTATKLWFRGINYAKFTSASLIANFHICGRWK